MFLEFHFDIYLKQKVSPFLETTSIKKIKLNDSLKKKKNQMHVFSPWLCLSIAHFLYRPLPEVTTNEHESLLFAI